MDQQYCYSPFYMVEISSDGEVFPCCPRYINFYSFGNIYEQSFEEIWYSKKADFFRKKILNNDYSLCNKNICFFNITKTKNEIFSNANNNLHPPVKFLRLAYDNTCNVACKTCRDSIIKNNDERKSMILEKLLPVLDKVEEIQLSTSGDIFSSKDSLDLIKYVSKNYPHIKFHIDTNGILFTPELYDTFQLQDKIATLNISIPGAKEKTYNKIVRYGNFKKLHKNLKFLSKEKQLGHIKDLNIIMIVHKINYREMPILAQYAKNHQVNIIFSMYQPWEHTQMAKNYKKLAVFEKDNPHFEDFLKILSNPILSENHCKFEPYINELKEHYHINLSYFDKLFQKLEVIF